MGNPECPPGVTRTIAPRESAMNSHFQKVFLSEMGFG